MKKRHLKKYAARIGLDVAKFSKALKAGTYRRRVDADYKLGGQVAVSGTPTMFINGKRASNPADVAGISKS